MLNCESFQYRGPKQISYLCVLVKNGNLVYKEWFNLDLVKKIKPALNNQGKLHFNFEETTDAKGQINDGVSGQIQKETPLPEGECGTLTPNADLLS